MITRNWMKKDPVTIHSDALISEAMSLMAREKLAYLPVVDKEVLRGILLRRDLLEAATSVAARQCVHESAYFHKRLKVKDLMVRMPQTVDADAPVEQAMKKGMEMGLSFFPVMEKGRLVGTVSYSEIFETMSQILGIREDWVGITLEGLEVGRGTMARVARDVEETGAVLHSLFTLRREGSEGKKIIVRLETDRLDEVVRSLEDKGYRIAEVKGPLGGGLAGREMAAPGSGAV
jgi:acetoin utilization protein AcuB